LVSLFTGPSPIAEMVRDELIERGVAADIQGEDPLGQIFGSAAAPSVLESVVVTEEEAERQHAAIEEVLAMVSEVAGETETDEESGDEAEQ
jgi:hypothetical protein